MKTKYPWLGPLNYYLLQFFFIRLAYCLEISDADLYECSVMPDGLGTSMRAKHVRIRWGVMYLVIPLTGWGRAYKFIGRCRYKWFGK